MHKVPSILAIISLLLPPTTALSSTATKAMVVLPFNLDDSRVFLNCEINGSGPFSLILDTGGGGPIVITPQVAKALALKSRNPRMTGGGAGSAKMLVREADLSSVDVGALHLGNQAAVVIDLSAIRRNIGLRKLDGVLGFSVLKDLFVKLDFDRSLVTLSTYPIAAPRNAIRSRFILRDDVPHLGGKVDGIKGNFMIDTGDRSSLTLLNRFSTKYDFSKFGGAGNTLTGFGIGGPIFGKIIRVPTVSIFGELLDDVPARISRQTGGAFVSSSDAANIGMALLRRFNVIFDYSTRTITTWPSKHFAEPQIIDASGMWITSGNTGALVLAIAAGGPAAGAGIRPGDVVVSLDGRSTADRDADDLRHALSSSFAGKSMVVLVKNKRGQFVTHMRLRDPAPIPSDAMKTRQPRRESTRNAPSQDNSNRLA